MVIKVWKSKNQIAIELMGGLVIKLLPQTAKKLVDKINNVLFADLNTGGIQ